jgi:hypothetical protein
MMRRILAVGLALALAASPCLAQQGPPDTELDKGIRQAQTGDFENAVTTLDAVAKRLAAQGGRPKDLARAYVYLSIAYLGLSEEQKAKAQFLEAWKVDQGMELTAREFPPKVLQFFEEARKDARATASTGVTIYHNAVGCVVAGQFPILDARLAPPEAVGRAVVFFRPTGGERWYSVVMENQGGPFRGVLPKPLKTLKSLDYYLEVTDQRHATSRTADQTADVVSGPGACKDRLLAGGLSSAIPRVSGPAGSVGLPVVPAGFSGESVVAAGGTGTATTAASGAAAVGGGGASKGLIIGGLVAAAGAGVAVAAGGGGGSGPSPTTPSGNSCVPGPVTASVRPATGSSRCGLPSPAVTVALSNQSCQPVTITSIDLTRSDPNGNCLFQNNRLGPTASTVASKETRDVGGFGGGNVPYCPGGRVSSSYTCVDHIVVTVQSSAGSVLAGVSDITVQFDPSCVPCSAIPGN